MCYPCNWCGSCGKKIPRIRPRCIKCGAEVPEGRSSCQRCGAEYPVAPAGPVTFESRVDAENRDGELGFANG